jgi:Tfp pilus assembly major pilin PilA
LGHFCKILVIKCPTHIKRMSICQRVDKVQINTKNQRKYNWKRLGSSSQDSAQSRCTGLSGGAPNSVRCARLALVKRPLSGIRRRRTTKNSPDCPVSQRSAAQSARNAWPSQRSEGGTGLSGVHRTVSGAPTAPNLQRSSAPE